MRVHAAAENPLNLLYSAAAVRAHIVDACVDDGNLGGHLFEARRTRSLRFRLRRTAAIGSRQLSWRAGPAVVANVLQR